MHYYNFNISTYHSHTSHLSETEDLAYRRMLDWSYLHESPLPNDIDKIAKLIRMRPHSECIASVLEEYFTKEEEGYFNSRVNSDIAEYRGRSEQAKAAAKARWDKKALKDKQLRADATAKRTQCDRNAKQELRTKKQELVTNKDKLVIPIGINIDSWNEWFNYRKAKKKTISEAAAKKQFKLLLEHTREEQQAIIDKSISNDYQGLFKPKGNNYEKTSNNGSKQDNSAVGRVEANAKRELEKLRQAENNQPMANDDATIRPQMDEQLRGRDRSSESLGGVIEGDFTRSD